MPTTIQCGKCDKRYTIHSQFAGKRVKCKNCGNRIAIPAPGAAPDAATGDDPLAGWDDEEDERDLGPPPTFELPEDALPPEPTPAAVATAVQPGYLEALSELQAAAAPKAPRLPLRERLDGWAPWWAGRVFVGGFVGAAIVPWGWSVVHRLPWRNAMRDSVAELIALAVFYFVTVRLAEIGTRIGARLAKFDLPPDLLRRLRAALLVPVILGVAVWLPLTHLHEGGHVYKVVSGRLTSVPTMTWSPEPIMELSAYTPHNRMVAESALGVCVLAGLFAYRFFFRLGWKKALLSFPVMALFFVVGLAAVLGAGWGAVKVTGFVLKVAPGAQ